MCIEKTPWEQVIDFHGETTAEIALGYRLARIAMREMGTKPSPDSALLIKAEIHSGALDAFQVICQATVGRGTLQWENIGRHVYYFHYSGTDTLLCLTVSQHIVARISDQSIYENRREKQLHTLQTIEHLLSAHEDDFCSITFTPGHFGSFYTLSPTTGS